MYKLVVLSALFACAAARPSHLHTPLIAGAPAVAYAAPAIAHAPVVAHAPLVAAAPAVVATAVHAPAVAVHPVSAITKTVHYADQPVVTGYTSQIFKPDLGAIATPLATVTKEKIIAPARTVATIHPKITEVHPELHVQKVPVDVPVPHPVVSEVEVRHVAPVVHAAPVAPIVEARLAAPVVHAAPIAPIAPIAPVVEARVAAPVVHAAAPIAVAHATSYVAHSAPLLAHAPLAVRSW